MNAPARQSQQPGRRRATKKELAARRQRYADLQWLMSDARGRRLVWQWIDAGGMFRGTYGPNALEMAFNEGRRAWALQMTTELHAYTPEHYLAMTRENSPTAAILLRDEINDDSDTDS